MKLEPEPCMHCGAEIVPLVRGLGGQAVCTPCGVERLGPLVFAIRAGCQAGEAYLHDSLKKPEEKEPMSNDLQNEICSGCGKPPRKDVTLGELITKTRFCEACWEEKLKLLNSGDLDQQAQAQYDKVMRDVGAGVEPMEAWKKKDETDG